MMTKSDLFGAVPSMSGNVSLPISPGYSTEPQEEGDDFLAMVSQAMTRNQDNPPPLQSSEAPSSLPQTNYDTAYGSDDEADDSQCTALNTPKPGNQPASQSPAGNEDPTDPSILSAIMALFGQPVSPPAEPQYLVPAQGKDPKVTQGQGDSEAVKLKERGSPNVEQKLSVLNNQLSQTIPLKDLPGLDSKQAVPSAIKSPADAGKHPPANALPPGQESPPAKGPSSPSSLLQLTVLQDLPLATQERLEPAVPVDGMDTALNKQRMKFASEKNEIAGRAVKKLPDASPIDDFAGDLTVKVNAKSASEFPESTKDSFDPNLLIDLSAKSSMTDLMQAKLADRAPTGDTAAAQVDRVAQLVTREVITVRQSGANSLAVSLKVDSHTELFLQLTNHGGQIQAALRCERGDAESLGAHWEQLQESLARQNVQLLPLQDPGSFRNSAFDTPSDRAASHSFDQSPQNQQRKTRASHEKPSAAGVIGDSITPRKTKINRSSRQGWESWA